MRYLKPKGPKIEIHGDLYELKYTLDVIDELQDKTQLPVPEILYLTTKKRTKKKAVRCLLEYLTGQLIEVNDDELDYYSFLLINTYIEQLKYKDMPLPKRHKDVAEFEFVNVEHWFYIGTVVLGKPDEKVWQMTLGQINTLHHEHLKCQGLIKEDKEVSIDEAIPI